ncbi:MAG: hypothetical protein ACTSRW_10280 [Candidatus Helarchaeota archaeon]
MIYDFYILERSGTCIFHQAFSALDRKQVEADLISGFFSAMCLFSREIADKHLEILELEDVRLVFTEDKLDNQEYIFVAFVDENESVLQIQDILKKISKKFFQNYKHILKNWNRDTEIFTDFQKQIELIIIKADIDRFMLIEKLEEIVKIEQQTHLEGLSIYTSKGDLMISNIELPSPLKKFISRTIECQFKTSVKIDELFFKYETKYILIRPITNSLVGVFLTAPKTPFKLGISLADNLVKILKEKIQVAQ